MRVPTTIRIRLSVICVYLLMGLPTFAASTDEKPLPQAWDYAAAMQKVAARFQGRPGVVLHIGDSITYTKAFLAFLAWNKPEGFAAVNGRVDGKALSDLVRARLS